MPAPMHNIKGVIFDLDGTLGDTVEISLEAFRRAFYKCSGKTYTDEEILAKWGPTEEGIFMEMFPDDWQGALEQYLTAYDQLHVEHGVAAFAGMPELLACLDQAGLRLAVVTAKGPHSAEISLRHFDMLERFDYVETGSLLRTNKPERIGYVLSQWGLQDRDVLYVGDFPSDITASRMSGTVAVGAAWAKTADAAELSRHQPDYLFETIQDFRDWLVSSTNHSG